MGWEVQEMDDAPNCSSEENAEKKDFGNEKFQIQVPALPGIYLGVHVASIYSEVVPSNFGIFDSQVLEVEMMKERFAKLLLESSVVVGVGLAESPNSMEKSEKLRTKAKPTGLNLKATELRLGLPGSESPERDDDDDDEEENKKNLYSSLGLVKSSTSCFVSGAKRGFSDAIDGVCGSLFSPKGVECNKNHQDSVSVVVKDQIAVLTPKPLDNNHEKKPQISNHAPPPPPSSIANK